MNTNQIILDSYKFSEFEMVYIVEANHTKRGIVEYTTWELIHVLDGDDEGDLIATYDSMGNSYEDCRNDYLSYLNSIQG